MIEKWKGFARLGIILGSGLNDSVDEMMEIQESIAYTEIPGLKTATAPGHKGAFLFGKIKNVPIIAMQGRFHYYEGHSMKDIIAPIKLLSELGVDTLIVSNAAGGINLTYQAGDLMVINDHINFLGTNPLIGPAEDGFDRFPDMSFTYDRKLIQLFHECADQYPINVHDGVYLATTGPSYETPAEIKAFRVWGADAVGMSTVPEVIAARHRNMRVFGISLISNMAAGVLDQKLSEEEVLEAGRKVQSVFKGVMSDFIEKVGVGDE